MRWANFVDIRDSLRIITSLENEQTLFDLNIRDILNVYSFVFFILIHTDFVE